MSTGVTKRIYATRHAESYREARTGETVELQGLMGIFYLQKELFCDPFIYMYYDVAYGLDFGERGYFIKFFCFFSLV